MSWVPRSIPAQAGDVPGQATAFDVRTCRAIRKSTRGELATAIYALAAELESIEEILQEPMGHLEIDDNFARAKKVIECLNI